MKGEGMTSEALRQSVRRGAGSSARLIVDVLKRTLQIDAPIEVSPAAFLTLCFRHDLDADEHQIFRTALLEILDAYAVGEVTLSGETLDEFVYVMQSSSLPRRRRTEVTALIFHCILTAEARGDRAATVSFLNLLADEVLVTSVDDWADLYERFQPDGALACFFGIGRIDLESALRWLSSEREVVDYDSIREFAIPSLLRAEGSARVVRVVEAVSGDIDQQVLSDVRSAYRRVYGVRLRLVAEQGGRRDQASAAEGAVRAIEDHRVRAWVAPEWKDDMSARERIEEMEERADARPGDEVFFPPGLATIGVAV